MRRLLSILFCVTFGSACLAQSTVTSGNWTDPTVWSGGAVPAAGGTVNVNNPLIIDTNLTPTGVWTFNSNATDVPGGTKYTFNPNAGANAITISAGATVTFEGGTAGTPNSFDGGKIDIFGTLILGYTELHNAGNLNITVKPGGTLIINGDLVNKNNSGTFVIDGALIINGNFDNQTGSVTVAGAGSIDTSGTLTSNGGSTVFGTTNDCAHGPCSGSSLACTFDNYITPSTVTVCSGTSTVTFTSNPVTSNAPSSPSYQWKSSTDNITFNNVGTNTASYTTPLLTLTTYVKVTITATGPACTSTSATAKITVLTSGGWIGTTNNWGTNTNWCGNVLPDLNTDVVITNGTGIAAMPIINAGTAANVRNLTISNTFPGSSVTLAASGTASLNVYGDFTNNGTFTDNSTASAAGAIFSGAVPQTISGLTPNVFNNLTIANTTSPTPLITIASNNVAVNNNLTMTSGMLNLNGLTISLGASAASTGTLNWSAGSWMYGGNMQRWFPTAAVTTGTNPSLFPIGSSSDYRPIYFGSSGLTSAGGTIKASHTQIAGSTAVSFTDGVFTVGLRSNSSWKVTTGNGISSTGTPFDIRTEASGAGHVFAVADLRLTLVSAASPGAVGAFGGTPLIPQVNRTGLSVANLSNTFYWGSVNVSVTTLPITLISFNGQQVSNHIGLAWATASEINSNYFTVQKSTNGTDFSDLGNVNSHGTTTSSNSYKWTDSNPLIGVNYYRLKSVDIDGTFSHTGIIAVEFSEDRKISIFPNPSDGKSLSIKLNFNPQEPISIGIMDNTGLMMGKYSLDQQEAVIQFSTPLKPGMYLVRLTSSGISDVIRFVVIN